ncbi:Regulatory protein SoxS [compost metagenome]
MYEWNEMVQLMVDWVDGHLDETPSLLKMSQQLGYSPYYCTRQFHSLTGMTLRDYVKIRRINCAALELRDTDDRILDIAVRCGFSSQEALTRSFVKAFGITPYSYRKTKQPIQLAVRQEVFSPYHYLKDNDEVMKAVEALAWNFDPESIGYEWDAENKHSYQRHFPEDYGYAILRPVKKKV